MTGWAACRLLGAAFLDGLRPDGRTLIPVPLALGPGGGIRPSAEVVLDRERLDGDDVVETMGIRCTIPERATFDAARTADTVHDAVVVLDAATAGEITSLKRMRRYVAGRAGWTGVAQVRAALALASERSRSPAETRMRLLWQIDAGLPEPLVNWPVLGPGGRLIAVVDLLDIEAGVVGEFDGADHRDGARHTRDVRREDALRRAGLEFFTVTGRDLGSPDLVVERMRATRARALVSPHPRLWIPGATGAEVTLDELLDRRDLARRQRF